MNILFIPKKVLITPILFINKKEVAINLGIKPKQLRSFSDEYSDIRAEMTKDALSIGQLVIWEERTFSDAALKEAKKVAGLNTYTVYKDNEPCKTCPR